MTNHLLMVPVLLSLSLSVIDFNDVFADDGGELILFNGLPLTPEHKSFLKEIGAWPPKTSSYTFVPDLQDGITSNSFNPELSTMGESGIVAGPVPVLPYSPQELILIPDPDGPSPPVVPPYIHSDLTPIGAFIPSPGVNSDGIMENADPFRGTADISNIGESNFYDLPTAPGINLTPETDFNLLGVDPSSITPSPYAPTPTREEFTPGVIIGPNSALWGIWFDMMIEKGFDNLMPPLAPPDYIPEPAPTSPTPAPSNPGGRINTPPPSPGPGSGPSVSQTDGTSGATPQPPSSSNNGNSSSGAIPPPPPPFPLGVPSNNPDPGPSVSEGSHTENTPNTDTDPNPNIPQCCDPPAPTLPDGMEPKPVTDCEFCPPVDMGGVPSPLSWGTVTNTQVWPDQCKAAKEGHSHWEDNTWWFNAYLDETVCMNIKKSGGWSLVIDEHGPSTLDGCKELLCNFYNDKYETVYGILSGTQFDSNQDGWFGPGDYKWKYAKAWEHDTGKLVTLESLYIRAFNLSHVIHLDDDYTDYEAWKDPERNGIGQYSDCSYETDWAYQRAISQGWTCTPISDDAGHERIVAYNPYGVLYATGGFKETRDYVIGFWTPEQVAQS